MTNKALVCWEILWLETQGTSQLAYTWRCCARYPLTPFMQCWNGVEVQLCFLGWAVLQRLLGSWWFEMPGWSWDDFWEDQVTKPTKIKPSHVVCGWVGLLGMSCCISGGLLVVWCCFLEMHHPEISQNLSFFSFFLFTFFLFLFFPGPYIEVCCLVSVYEAFILFHFTLNHPVLPSVINEG